MPKKSKNIKNLLNHLLDLVLFTEKLVNLTEAPSAKGAQAPTKGFLTFEFYKKTIIFYGIIVMVVMLARHRSVSTIIQRRVQD